MTPLEMPEKITSRDNPKIKFARSVRDGREPVHIFIEGVRLAEEALRSGIEVQHAFLDSAFTTKKRNRELADLIEEKKIEAFELNEKAFRSIADTVNAQGVVLLAYRPASDLESIERRLHEPGILPLVLFLHEINNPSNLGAILRTAEAAGVAGIIVSSRSADVFSPKSLRASMGSAFRLPIRSNAEIENVFEWAGSKGLISTAADIRGRSVHTSVDWRAPRLLIFGSEAHGLGEDRLDQVKELTFIPMRKGVESLNLAVSCGIILFEAARQNSSG